MTSIRNQSPNSQPPAAPRRALLWSGMVFALAFPTFITWAYFVLAAHYSTGVQQATYLLVKCIQFAFPLVWVGWVLREPLRLERPNSRGLLLGIMFSVAVVAAGWFVFDSALRDTAVFAAASAKIHDKIGQFGINAVWKYALLAAFYSIVHSLLEEYYWRWFVFRQLRKLVPLWPAVFISSVAFMAHHVVILREFFHQMPWLAWLFSSAVAVGGVFWAWLYERSGSLYATWVSHLLIDAGIFWVGFDLVRGAMTGIN